MTPPHVRGNRSCNQGNAKRDRRAEACDRKGRHSEFCLSANLTKTDRYVIAQLVAEHSKKYCTAQVFKQTLNEARLEELRPPPGAGDVRAEGPSKPEIAWTGETTAEACDQAEEALVRARWGYMSVSGSSWASGRHVAGSGTAPR